MKIILILALLYALSKWIIWRLNTLAILLYYGECGIGLPDAETIQKYRTKVVMKSFHIKEG